MPKGKVKTVSFNKVCKWLSENLCEDLFIGYYVDGTPYIDKKQVLREFRKAFAQKA